MIANPSLLESGAAAIRPTKKPPLREWAEERMRFSDIDKTTRYVVDISPYAQTIFDWWQDRTVEEIFLIWPAQSGKTAVLSCIMSYCAANDPNSMMFVQAEEEPTKAFVKHRLRPTIERTLPELRTNWHEEDGNHIGNMFVWVAWGSSDARMRSWPIRYVLGDETSIWTRSRLLAWERTKQYIHNRKALWCTTPTGEYEASWVDATTRFQLHRWAVPCPHCGAFQVLEFKNLKFDHCRIGDGKWNLDQVEAETYYPCEACEKPIREKDRNRMLQAGVAKNVLPEVSGKTKSLRITCLDVPALSFGLSARTFLNAQGDPENLRAFVTSWLAEPFKDMRAGLKSRAVMSRTMDLQAGVCPADTVALGCGVDTQRGHLWVVVRAWLADGRSTLVWCGHIDGRDEGAKDKKKNLTEEEIENSTEVALQRLFDQVLDRSWDWEDNQLKLKIRFCAIDNGDGVTKDLVDRFAYDHYGLIYPVKGDARVATVQASPLSRDTKGGALPGSLFFYRVHTELYRQKIIDAYRQSFTHAGAWMINRDIPDVYGEHIEVWQQVTVEKRDPKGRVKTKKNEWRKTYDGAPDHLLDAEIYAESIKTNFPMLDMIVVHDGNDTGKETGERQWRGPALPPGAKRERF